MYLASIALAVAVLRAAPDVAVFGAAPDRPGVPPPLGVARIVSDENAPGAQVLVLDHGRVVYEHDFGVRDLTMRRPVDAHTRFEIGSITKQFTAAAILQLSEQGKLSLSDPLEKYVPQYRLGRRITIQQLLWQVSGIPDYTDGPAFRKLIVRRGYRAVFSKPVDLNVVLSLITGQRLHFQPGSAWEYSNTNYFLLGEVVAAASGIPWERYVRTHLFEPARMHESSFSSDEAQIADMATGYALARVTFKPIPTGPDCGVGDGAIVSTARDLAKWNAALFGGTIVSPRSLALMTAPGPHPSGPQEGYGFGLVIGTYDGVRRVAHNGRTLGFTSMNQVYPFLSQEVIVLATGGDADAGDIADIAFDQHNAGLAARANVGANGADPAITAVVNRLWSGMASGHVDQTLLSPSMGRFMAGPAGRATPFAHYGAVSRWIYRGRTGTPRGPLYRYRLLFVNGLALDLNVIVTAQHKVAGLTYWRR
jgi:CubicO group peptidase (beta-lactamase class C family)